MCIAQNGPGITNFVTAVAAAYWNHTPMVVITPETGSNTQGLGGFQETRQLPCFEEITCHQETLSHPARIAEALSRCFQRARQHGAPVQFNLPRDMFCQIDRHGDSRTHPARAPHGRRSRRVEGGSAPPEAEPAYPGDRCRCGG